LHFNLATTPGPFGAGPSMIARGD